MLASARSASGLRLNASSARTRQSQLAKSGSLSILASAPAGSPVANIMTAEIPIASFAPGLKSSCLRIAASDSGYHKDVFAQSAFADFSYVREEEVLLRRLIGCVDSPFSVNACAISSARIARSAIRGCPIRINRDVERRGGPRHADIWSERRGCAQVQEFAPFSDRALRRTVIEFTESITRNVLFLWIGGQGGN
jgi:hypothetical protein